MRQPKPRKKADVRGVNVRRQVPSGNTDPLFRQLTRAHALFVNGMHEGSGKITIGDHERVERETAALKELSAAMAMIGSGRPITDRRKRVLRAFIEQMERKAKRPKE